MSSVLLVTLAARKQVFLLLCRFIPICRVSVSLVLFAHSSELFVVLLIRLSVKMRFVPLLGL